MLGLAGVLLSHFVEDELFFFGDKICGGELLGEGGFGLGFGGGGGGVFFFLWGGLGGEGEGTEIHFRRMREFFLRLICLKCGKF